jgi:hypothetical protein
MRVMMAALGLKSHDEVGTGSHDLLLSPNLDSGFIYRVIRNWPSGRTCISCCRLLPPPTGWASAFEQNEIRSLHRLALLSVLVVNIWR